MVAWERAYEDKCPKGLYWGANPYNGHRMSNLCDKPVLRLTALIKQRVYGTPSDYIGISDYIGVHPALYMDAYG